MNCEVRDQQSSERDDRRLNAFRALPVYPVYEDEKLVASDKKIAKKADD